MIQTVPYSEELERALIVGLLSDPSIISRVTAELEEEDFFKDQHREIYKVIRSLEIDKVDSLTVQDNLSSSAKEYFSELVKNSDSILPSLTNVRIYAQTIKDKSKLRAGINLGREITATCFEPNIPADDVLQKLEDMFAKFLQNRLIDNKKENTKSAFEEFLTNLNFKREEIGTRTGFHAIDSLVGNLEGLTVLAARPGSGKTALAIQIMRYVAQTRHVAFFSLEQSRDQVFERMLATEAGVNSKDIRSGEYLSDPALVERIAEASLKIKTFTDNIHIDETPAVDAQYITSVARQKKFEWGDLGLIVVDYLHIMKLKDGNKVDVLGDAVKDLRAIGKELHTPVLLLSQLSRASETFVDHENKRRNRRPELTDLRSSGEIEQSADVVMFLWKESQFDSYITPAEEFVEVLVRKNRLGPIGMSNIKWTPRFLRFSDV